MLPGDVDSLLDTAPADIVIRITYRNTLYTLGKQTNQPPAYRTIDGPQHPPGGPTVRAMLPSPSHGQPERPGLPATGTVTVTVPGPVTPVARRARRGPGHTMIYLFYRVTTVILMVTGIT